MWSLISPNFVCFHLSQSCSPPSRPRAWNTYSFTLQLVFLRLLLQRTRLWMSQYGPRGWSPPERSLKEAGLAPQPLAGSADSLARKAHDGRARPSGLLHGFQLSLHVLALWVGSEVGQFCIVETLETPTNTNKYTFWSEKPIPPPNPAVGRRVNSGVCIGPYRGLQSNKLYPHQIVACLTCGDFEVEHTKNKHTFRKNGPFKSNSAPTTIRIN